MVICVTEAAVIRRVLHGDIRRTALFQFVPLLQREPPAQVPAFIGIIYFTLHCYMRSNLHCALLF